MPDLRQVPAHVGYAFPSTCVVCSHPAGTIPFIDLVVEHPGYGHLYLCEVCVHACGRELGMLAPADAERLRAQARSAQTDLDLTRAMLAEAQETRTVRLSDLTAAVKGVVAEQVGRLVPATVPGISLEDISRDTLQPAVSEKPRRRGPDRVKRKKRGG